MKDSTFYDLLNKPYPPSSDVYWVNLVNGFRENAIKVYCDTESDGGSVEK